MLHASQTGEWERPGRRGGERLFRQRGERCVDGRADQRVRLKVAGTGWWVLSRCDKTSPRRAGGPAVVKDAPSTHPPAPLCAARLLAARAVPPPRFARHFQSHPIPNRSSQTPSTSPKPLRATGAAFCFCSQVIVDCPASVADFPPGATSCPVVIGPLRGQEAALTGNEVSPGGHHDSLTGSGVFPARQEVTSAGHFGFPSGQGPGRAGNFRRRPGQRPQGVVGRGSCRAHASTEKSRLGGSLALPDHGGDCPEMGRARRESSGFRTRWLGARAERPLARTLRYPYS